VLVADRAGARTRRDHDGVARVEYVYVPAYEVRLEVTAVRMHLAAARLLQRELHRLPEPFEQVDSRLAGIGKSASTRQVVNNTTRIRGAS
jgi:hypothetical protein